MQSTPAKSSPPETEKISTAMDGIFSAPNRGYNFSTAGSFRITSGSFQGLRSSRRGPSPAAIKEAADEIDRARRVSFTVRHISKPRWFNFHPHGVARQRWDIFTVFLILYSSVIIPLVVAFDYDPPLGIRVMSWCIDVLFGIDIILNFVTGVEVMDRAVIYEMKTIAWHYISGWFCIDLVAAFPFELFTQSDSDQIPQILKVFKLFRLLRLLRLLRIMRIVNRLESSLSIQDGVRQLGIFGVLLLLLTHWFTCTFYYVGNQNRDENGFWANGLLLDGTDLNTNYIAATYWSIMTLTTVGYGDISANCNGQRVLGIITMIVGALFYAYGVSHVVSIVDEVRSETRAFKNTMDRFNGYMAARDLPLSLRGDIREFLHNKRRRQKQSIRDEESLLGQLSMGLRSRVAMAINEHYLREMPFFLGADVNLTMELGLNMESCFFPAFEDVVREGEEGDAMFFVVAGSVEVLVGQTQTRVAVLIEKQYFGEAALLMPEGNRRRTATVRTLQFSEFRVLRAQDFLRILVDYPDTRKQIEQLAESRMRVLKKKQNKGGQLSSLKKNSSRRFMDTIKPEPPPISRRSMSSRTLIDSLGSLDPETINSALEKTDRKNLAIQEHIFAIQTAHEETHKRLLEIQTFMQEIKEQQGQVRRASLKVAHHNHKQTSGGSEETKGREELHEHSQKQSETVVAERAL